MTIAFIDSYERILATNMRLLPHNCKAVWSEPLHSLLSFLVDKFKIFPDYIRCVIISTNCYCSHILPLMSHRVPTSVLQPIVYWSRLSDFYQILFILLMDDFDSWDNMSFELTNVIRFYLIICPFICPTNNLISFVLYSYETLFQ